MKNENSGKKSARKDKNSDTAIQQINQNTLHVFERISDAFVALDKNWCYTYMNRKAGQIFSRDPRQIIGKHIWTEFPEGIGQPFQLAFEKAMRDQQYVYLEEYYAPFDKWFEIQIYPSPDGLSVFFRDITDRKKMEEKLNKTNRLYNFISQVNQLIVRTSSADSLFREVCEIAIRNGRFRLAWIGIVDDKTGIVEPVVFAGEENGYLGSIKKINTGLTKAGKGPTGSAIRNGETVVCNNMATDPRMEPWREEAIGRGFHSSIAVPIRRGGQVIGAFSLYAEEADFFDEAEIELLEEATGDISFALDNFDRTRKHQEAELAVRVSEEKLRRIFNTTTDVLFMLEKSKEGHFRFISVNQQFLEITGLEESAVTGRLVSDIIPTASWPMVKANYENAIRERRTIEWEQISAFPTGTKTGIVTVTPVFNDDTSMCYLIGSVQDITAIREYTRKLDYANERFNLISMATRDALWELNLQTGELWGNETHQQLYGRTLNDPIATPEEWIKRIHPDDRDSIVQQQHSNLLSLTNTFISEYRFLNGQNQYRIIYDRCYITRDATGKAIRMLGSMMDLTDLKRAEEQYRKERELSDSLIDSLPGIFYLYSEKGVFLRWNANFETVSGYTAEEIMHMHPFDFFQESDKVLIRQKISNVFKHGEDHAEALFLQKNGAVVPYYFTGCRINYNNEVCLMGVGIDVEERVRAQEAIRKVNIQLRQLTAHLQTVREEERKRIGREIHDELGQQLTAIKMDVAWLNKRIPDSESLYKQKLGNIISLLDSSHLSVRKILNELRMGILEHQELEEALKWYGKQFTDNTGVPIQFECPRALHVTDEILATSVYRVFQESLTNITRYARAKSVLVRLWKDETGLHLIITDDGIGFDQAKIDTGKSFGILGMKERVSSLGGKLRVETNPGKGTTIDVEIPLSEKFKNDV